MWIFTLVVLALTAYANGQNFQNSSPRSGNDLVSTVLDNCVDMTCVKQNVLGYLDNMLNIQSDRNVKVKNLVSLYFAQSQRLSFCRISMLPSIRELLEFCKRANSDSEYQKYF